MELTIARQGGTNVRVPCLFSDTSKEVASHGCHCSDEAEGDTLKTDGVRGTGNGL